MLTFDGCDPGANPLVEKYFHDCVMDYRDTIGFILGLCSIFVWLTAQLPQFLSNIKNQSSEALSIWFLVEWFAGDTLNLLGCLIQGQQLPTTTMLAAYFVLMDVIMLLQYIYYSTLQARRRRLRAKTLRRRQGHRHAAGAAHPPGGEDLHRQVVRLLQDGGGIEDSSEASPCLDSSVLPKPTGVSTQHNSIAAGVEAPSSSSNLQTLTVAAAAAVSVVCVTALTLRAGGSFPSVRRRLLSIPALQHHTAAAIVKGNADSTYSLTSSSASAAADPGLAVWGPALSIAGRSLAATLYRAALHSPEGGDAGSNIDSGKSTISCSFLNCDVALVAGTAIGYLSTCFYLASRISQIRKNLSRRSTEGLSRVMFLLTMSANLCTGISIVVRLRSVEQAKEQLPWMCGTFGTIALDMTLFYQALTLGQHPQEVAISHEHCDSHRRHHHHSHDTQGHEHGHLGRSGTSSGRVVRKLSDLEAPLLGPITEGELG